MALDNEALAQIKENVDNSRKLAKSIRETISDLRASGIDASVQETRLNALESDITKWETFYGLQSKRAK